MRCATFWQDATICLPTGTPRAMFSPPSPPCARVVRRCQHDDRLERHLSDKGSTIRALHRRRLAARTSQRRPAPWLVVHASMLGCQPHRVPQVHSCNKRLVLRSCRKVQVSQFKRQQILRALRVAFPPLETAKQFQNRVGTREEVLE